MDKMMKQGLIVGTLVFMVGLIGTIFISLYPLFNDNDKILILGLKTSIVLMLVGGAILFIFVSFDRYVEYKRFKKDIKKEDLKP